MPTISNTSPGPKRQFTGKSLARIVSAARVGEGITVGEGATVDVAVAIAITSGVDVDVGVALAGRLQAMSINIKTSIRLIVRASWFM
jgi:hypothetical protein